MLKFLNKFLDSNQRELKRLQPQVDAINALQDDFKKLSDEELKGKTDEFKKRLKDGETLDDFLPEAYAAVREAARRTIGQVHFDVQMMAGIAFHRGMAVEQKTGEGKTLSATSALYLNGLTGRGAHLVTVNDYLARRDAGWMGPIYHLLGVSTGVIYAGKGDQPAALYDPEYQDKSATDDRLAHLKPCSRRDAYAAIITYGTNNEFGFDYLRGNMVHRLEQMVQRGHHFAIVDEVDSILIDEARTPLIISAPDTEPTDKYYRFAKLIDELNADIDYTIDEKVRTAQLTDHGLRKVEKKLGIENLYEKNFETIHHLEQALRSRTLYHRDKDYVVKENQVIIVDEHTGRLMFGRRYSEGLHQAIEAKEGVKIQQESKTLATISLQNYFRMYQKLSGMTGTAATEAEEFKKIYGLDVLVVPTNEPVIRVDHPDRIYKTQRAKFASIVSQVSDLHRKGQPVLLGTRSIEINQILSQFLKRKRVKHNVLNAKNHEKEAQILAEAGRKGAVTVATNMAGRGVDIVLGGDQEGRDEKDWQKEHEEVKKLGGLFVIGSERHESRRIDNQLRGRSGRQGDRGESRFYVSLEDEIMRIFGGDKIAGLMTSLKMPETEAIEHSLVSKAIEQAQSKVESWFFDQRKRVVEYDDVVNKQREIIYRRRRNVLEAGDGDEFTEKTWQRVEDEIKSLVLARASEGYSRAETEQIVREFSAVVPFDDASQKRLKNKLDELQEPEQISNHLLEIASQVRKQREKQLTPEIARQVDQFITLRTVDELWMEHLDALDDLREGIGLRGYAQQEPLVEYKKEAFSMFESLLSRIDSEIARRVFRVQPVGVRRPEPVRDIQLEKKSILPELQATSDKQPATGKMKEAEGFGAAFKQMAVRRPAGVGIRNTQKIGRNDPCPCGAINPNTQKLYKYKKCGLINAPYHKT